MLAVAEDMSLKNQHIVTKTNRFSFIDTAYNVMQNARSLMSGSDVTLNAFKHPDTQSFDQLIRTKCKLNRIHQKFHYLHSEKEQKDPTSIEDLKAFYYATEDRYGRKQSPYLPVLPNLRLFTTRLNVRYGNDYGNTDFTLEPDQNTVSILSGYGRHIRAKVKEPLARIVRFFNRGSPLARKEFGHEFTGDYKERALNDYYHYLQKQSQDQIIKPLRDYLKALDGRENAPPQAPIEELHYLADQHTWLRLNNAIDQNRKQTIKNIVHDLIENHQDEMDRVFSDLYQTYKDERRDISQQYLEQNVKDNANQMVAHLHEDIGNIEPKRSRINEVKQQLNELKNLTEYDLTSQYAIDYYHGRVKRLQNKLVNSFYTDQDYLKILDRIEKDKSQILDTLANQSGNEQSINELLQNETLYKREFDKAKQDTEYNWTGLESIHKLMQTKTANLQVKNVEKNKNLADLLARLEKIQQREQQVFEQRHRAEKIQSSLRDQYDRFATSFYRWLDFCTLEGKLHPKTWQKALTVTNDIADYFNKAALVVLVALWLSGFAMPVLWVPALICTILYSAMTSHYAFGLGSSLLNGRAPSLTMLYNFVSWLITPITTFLVNGVFVPLGITAVFNKLSYLSSVSPYHMSISTVAYYVFEKICDIPGQLLNISNWFKTKTPEIPSFDNIIEKSRSLYVYCNKAIAQLSQGDASNSIKPCINQLIEKIRDYAFEIDRYIHGLPTQIDIQDAWSALLAEVQKFNADLPGVFSETTYPAKQAMVALQDKIDEFMETYRLDHYPDFDGAAKLETVMSGVNAFQKLNTTINEEVEHQNGAITNHEQPVPGQLTEQSKVSDNGNNLWGQIFNTAQNVVKHKIFG